MNHCQSRDMPLEYVRFQHGDKCVLPLQAIIYSEVTDDTWKLINGLISWTCEGVKTSIFNVRAETWDCNKECESRASMPEKSVMHVFGTCYRHQLTDVQMRGEEIPHTATECLNKMHPETNTNVIKTSTTNQSQHHGKTENQWVHLGVQALLGPMIRHQYIQ
jgi:hypothetical protein